VHQAYGTAETGLLGYETAPGSGLALPTGVLVQVCDTDTGRPHLDDSPGQVVVTLLRPGQPLVRFGTGDLSAWILGRDGSLRLAGVLGRTGEAVKVRGLFLHPRQAA
jgi:phenylacetate-CoA ligase